MGQIMFFEDFTVGQRFTVPPVSVTKEKMKAFAEAYDPFPMHLDEVYAASTRFGAVIAPGVMSFMSVWAEFVKMDVWGGNIVAGKSTSMEWFAPAFAGDTLHGTVTITGKQQRNDYNGVVAFTIDVANQNGETILRDVTEFVIATRKGQGSPAPAGKA